MAYKPFGEKLNLDKYGNRVWGSNLRGINRGYTGHEHIRETHLMNMNARLYDPTIGRFLSADTFIDGMYSTQGFNRYSYVKNNPLKYTDPSGHFSLRKAFKRIGKFVKKHIKTIVTIAAVALVVAFPPAAIAGNMFAIGAAAGFTGGVVGTKLHGGSWSDALKAGVKGAITGAITAGVAHGMAELAGSHTASFFNSGAKGFGTALFKAVAQGVGRMAIARAQGQSTRSAFLSGFMSSGFAAPKSWGYFGGTMATVAVAGTVSQATGGKFANGAMTGAFIHLFNALGDGYNRAINKNKYPEGKTYGDGVKEVGRGAIKGAIITKNPVGTLVSAGQEAVLNMDTVLLDIKTTIDIADELVYDVAEEIIDYETAIKNDTVGW